MGTVRRQYTMNSSGSWAFSKQRPAIEPDCPGAGDCPCAAAQLAEQERRGQAGSPRHLDTQAAIQNFGFQPPRLEAVAQHADEKEGNCNHAMIML